MVRAQKRVRIRTTILNHLNHRRNNNWVYDLIHATSYVWYHVKVYPMHDYEVRQILCENTDQSPVF